MLLLSLTLVAAALATAMPARAQQPPTPGAAAAVFTIAETDAGFDLTVVGAAHAAGGSFDIEARVWGVGSDNAVIMMIGSGDRDSVTIPLPAAIFSGRQEGCYHVAFGARRAGDPHAVTIPGSLTTYGCADASGAMRYPAFDGTMTPPPAPPSGVRLLRTGENWSVAWEPSAQGDVLAYRAAVQLFDGRGGNLLGTVGFPDAPGGWASVGDFGMFGAGVLPHTARCGWARVLVFAIGPDAPSIWPGNTESSFCWDGARLSFPDAGDGTPAPARDIRAVIIALAACGGFAAGAGAAIRRRAQR